MNILDIFKYAKLAWSDEKQIQTVIAQAKTLEGPSPSYKTGEFWVNVVLPVVAGIVGGVASLVSVPPLVPYFVIATTVIALGSYLGRTWLKAKHLVAAKGLDFNDPDTLAQITAVVKNVSSAVSAIKSGDIAAEKTVTDTLNAPSTTVNVSV